MESFAVSFERTDEIRFFIDDDPELAWLREFDASGFQRIFVYIDANVRRRWGAKLTAALEAHGKQVFWLDVPSEESSKSLAFYPTALAFLEAQAAGRFDLVVAIGGGIVIDLVSFLASTYMRGLPFYAVPTTLIGQMDASTAGKTCLNTGSAKNLLGTFYYPRVVYNNTRFLETNTPYYLRQGYSEIFKYGLLRSPELVETLEAHHRSPAPAKLGALVKRSIEIRVLIRKQDPLASNLGHTFGHAIEKLSKFGILHGDAISAGTVMALEYARRKGLMAEPIARQIVDRMRHVNLNVFFDRTFTARDMVRLMLRDKKSSPDALYLVLIRGVGDPYHEAGSFFYRADPKDVEQFLEDYLTTSEFGITDCAGFLQRDQLYDALAPSAA